MGKWKVITKVVGSEELNERKIRVLSYYFEIEEGLKIRKIQSLGQDVSELINRMNAVTKDLEKSIEFDVSYSKKVRSISQDVTTTIRSLNVFKCELKDDFNEQVKRDAGLKKNYSWYRVFIEAAVNKSHQGQPHANWVLYDLSRFFIVRRGKARTLVSWTKFSEFLKTPNNEPLRRAVGLLEVFGPDILRQRVNYFLKFCKKNDFSIKKLPK